MAYPDDIETLAADIAGTDSMATRGHAALHNAANRILNAIQAELGTTPSGDFATVAAFLAGLQAGTAIDALDLAKITGAGDAAALDVGTTSGTVAAGDDARLSDARTPTAHASSHATAGADALAPSDIGAVASSTVAEMWTGTQAAYDALTPDAATLYVITG